MSEPIKVGDLVIVVRPMPCCGNNGKIGFVFTVIREALLLITTCHWCGAEWPTEKYGRAVILCDGHGRAINRLRKIDPPALSADTPAEAELKRT